MPAASPFDYAILRVVPRVERGECINVGVILFCRPRRFLGARVELNRERLAGFAPGLDLVHIEEFLHMIPRICEGAPDAGPIARLPQAERYHWLVAPRSAIVQTSPVHTGLCDDPQAALDHIFARMVATDTPS